MVNRIHSSSMVSSSTSLGIITFPITNLTPFMKLQDLQQETLVDQRSEIWLWPSQVGDVLDQTHTTPDDFQYLSELHDDLFQSWLTRQKLTRREKRKTRHGYGLIRKKDPPHSQEVPEVSVEVDRDELGDCRMQTSHYNGPELLPQTKYSHCSMRMGYCTVDENHRQPGN